ncbi:hypothetical protein B0H14DRAFT_2621076 [Mycena olivaceomarginata]|nr:hypothetical protein B0H14DRAFT_2621076 [Mycena olivaceomarginata]
MDARPIVGGVGIAKTNVDEDAGAPKKDMLLAKFRAGHAHSGRHDGRSARKRVDAHVRTQRKYLSYLIPETKYDAPDREDGRPSESRRQIPAAGTGGEWKNKQHYEGDTVWTHLHFSILVPYYFTMFVPSLFSSVFPESDLGGFEHIGKNGNRRGSPPVYEKSKNRREIALMREQRQMILKGEYHPRTWDDQDSRNVEFERPGKFFGTGVFLSGAGEVRRMRAGTAGESARESRAT